MLPRNGKTWISMDKRFFVNPSESHWHSQEAGNQSICIKSCAALPASAKLRATQMCHGEANQVWVSMRITHEVRNHDNSSLSVQRCCAKCLSGIKQLAPTERTQVVQVSGPHKAEWISHDLHTDSTNQHHNPSETENVRICQNHLTFSRSPNPTFWHVAAVSTVQF